MNPEKLKALQAQVRIGGKGTARRKKKVVHRTATTDDKKLQSSLKKLAVNNIPGIEESSKSVFGLAKKSTLPDQMSVKGLATVRKIVNMIREDGQVIHFNNPKVQASIAANTFAITGHAETKQITEMLPGILNQLGAESLANLKKLATTVSEDATKSSTGDIDEDEDEVPDLVGNFDEASKGEGV